MRSTIRHPAIWASLILLWLLLVLAIPITSDEAYFIAWGKSFQWGFYDHPPLPGWISYLVQGLDNIVGLPRHGPLHRLFSLGLGLSGLWLVVLRMRKRGLTLPVEPLLLALCVAPGFLILSSLYLNDSVLAFTVLLFVLAVEAAYRASRHVWVALLLAALAFDLVLLTKYNGALVYLGLGVALLSWPAGRRFLFGRFVLISLLALPVFLGHLWWNYQHCSINLAFNFGFRDSRATGFGPLWLMLTLLIMAGPLGYGVLWHLLTQRTRNFGFFSRLFLGTLAVMLVVSILRREFGVNWGAPLGFLALLALAEIAPFGAPVWSRRLGLGLSVLTLGPLAVILLLLKFGVLPASMVAPSKVGILNQQLDLANGSLIAQLRPLAKGRVVAAGEYGIAAVLDNARFDHTTVFSRSVFGRNQDLMTDFRALNGRDVLFVPYGGVVNQASIAPLFDSLKIVTLQTARQSYQVALGQGFRFAAYRTGWILPVISALYDKSRFPYGACLMDSYR